MKIGSIEVLPVLDGDARLPLDTTFLAPAPGVWPWLVTADGLRRFESAGGGRR